MNLHALLETRLSESGPIRVGLIGAGKFATMFLSQARGTPGLHILAVCDLNPSRAADALTGIGFTPAQIGATSFSEAASKGTTHLTQDAAALIAAPGIEVVVDATGDPLAGIRHALACCEAGRHIVMVNVEADALAGPMLAQRARQAGIVYSLAYGDQPALIAEQVDWARTAGFEVVCAGKGTKYLPEYHQSTPDTVWSYYGLSAEQAAAGGMNPKMFNSFLDGTKSAIEMAAVANATGLRAPPDGLAFPASDVRELPRILKPAAAGGTLAHSGMVEVVSSLRRDGSEVARDLRWGVFVVFEAPTDYAARCFAEYGLVTDDSGRYSAMYKPYHLIGLELGISVASVALRGEPTGQPRRFLADVAATAKRDLRAGERLDGEGGYRVWGRLMPAADSLAHHALPIGLAHDVTLRNDVASGQTLTWNDVDMDLDNEAVRVRREMELETRGGHTDRSAG